MLQLNYTLIKQDYVNYYLYMYWDEKKKKKARLKNLLKQLLYNVIILVAIYFSNVGRQNFTFVLIIFAIIFTTTLLSFVGGKASLEKQANNIANDVDNQSIFTQYTLIASDEALVVKTTFCESKFYWKTFVDKMENEAYYYLFENALQAVLIPKHAFKNNDEKVIFDTILLRNLPLEIELKN